MNKGLRIFVEGNFAEINWKDEKVFAGKIEEGTTHEDLYKEFYSDVLIQYEDEAHFISTFDDVTKENTIEYIMDKYECNREDVEVSMLYVGKLFKDDVEIKCKNEAHYLADGTTLEEREEVIKALMEKYNCSREDVEVLEM